MHFHLHVELRPPPDAEDRSPIIPKLLQSATASGSANKLLGRRNITVRPRCHRAMQQKTFSVDPRVLAESRRTRSASASLRGVACSQFAQVRCRAPEHQAAAGDGAFAAIGSGGCACRRHGGARPRRVPTPHGTSRCAWIAEKWLFLRHIFSTPSVARAPCGGRARARCWRQRLPCRLGRGVRRCLHWVLARTIAGMR
jgi:hypothetical protein